MRTFSFRGSEMQYPGAKIPARKSGAKSHNSAIIDDARDSEVTGYMSTKGLTFDEFGLVFTSEANPKRDS